MNKRDQKHFMLLIRAEVVLGGKVWNFISGVVMRSKIATAAHDLGVENVLVVPGAVHIPWRDDHEPVANGVCDQPAREAVGQWAKQAEKLKVCLNIENIFLYPLS